MFRVKHPRISTKLFKRGQPLITVLRGPRCAELGALQSDLDLRSKGRDKPVTSQVEHQRAFRLHCTQNNNFLFKLFHPFGHKLRIAEAQSIVPYTIRTSDIRERRVLKV